jgi:hypothetical protein
MGVSVGRLPQEVLEEEFYRSECSETVRVGRVRVSEEFLAVFNCSVLTFWNRTPEYVTISFHILHFLSGSPSGQTEVA